MLSWITPRIRLSGSPPCAVAWRLPSPKQETYGMPKANPRWYYYAHALPSPTHPSAAYSVDIAHWRHGLWELMIVCRFCLISGAPSYGRRSKAEKTTAARLALLPARPGSPAVAIATLVPDPSHYRTETA